MRVLHFYKTYYPDTVGGIEQVIRQMCVGTGRLGVQNQVLTLTRQKSNFDIPFEGHHIKRAPQDFEIASNSVSLASIGHLARMAEEADVVHYHFPWPFMDMAHFLARVRKPTLVTYHSDIVRQKTLLRVYQPLMQRFLRNLDTIVATSPNYLASSPVLNQHRDRTRIITYGLDKSIYPKADPARMAKWRARIGERFFLFIGVLRYYKGLHILLEAMVNCDYPVVIVGAGPIEMELKAQAEQLGVKNVHFVGQVDEDDKVALLSACYAMSFPSHLRSEAFGISLLEGAMYGKPMISAEIGTGTSYINVHNETGLVVPASDPRALREAMRVLWDNPALAAAMGRRAEARFQEHFTAERMATNYTALYHELAARRATAPVGQVQAGRL